MALRPVPWSNRASAWLVLKEPFRPLLLLPRVKAGSKANARPACSARLLSAWLRSPAAIEKLRTALAWAPGTEGSTASSGVVTKAIATESASGCNGRTKRDMGNPAKG
ncbi:hypothetical protein D3C73_1237520 [compost metagenome]